MEPAELCYACLIIKPRTSALPSVFPHSPPNFGGLSFLPRPLRWQPLPKLTVRRNILIELAINITLTACYPGEYSPCFTPQLLQTERESSEAMNKQCKLCHSPFEITSSDLEFYQKVSPIFDGKLYSIPPPTLCPMCRQQRRMTFRNERKLYPDSCDRCSKKIISLYSPDKPYQVYCPECYLGDNWDASVYGRPFDFSRPFFEQFRELQLAVPRIAIFGHHNENCHYANHSSKNKNCYLGTGFGECEDCMFGHWVLHSKNVVDGLYVNQSEQCYQCSYCERGWQSHFSSFCSGLQDSLLCFECKDCSNCIGCVQLQHQKFQILNTPVSEAEFFRVRAEILSSRKKFEELEQKFKKLVVSAPRRHTYQISCEDSVGDDLWNCKNSYWCFNCRELEDCKYMFDLGNNRTSMDCFEHGYLVQSELNYEAHAGMAGYHLLFCNLCSDSRDLTYCDLCGNGSHDLFGCIGLRKRSYCILNQQYTAADYRRLVPEIIASMQGEWGEFFPSRLSPFGYNETVAPEYYPLSKHAAESANFNWSDYELVPATPERVISAESVPENILLVSDDILKCAIECEVSKRLFRITTPELAFYRLHSLPLPRRHPDQRHIDRMKNRNPRSLVSRFCESCGENVESTVPLARPEMVYCQKCYERAVNS